MTAFAGRVGLSGTKQGLTAIDVSAADHVLAEPGIGLFTVAGGVIVFDDAFGVEHTITFPAWSGIDVGVSQVTRTGTTATGIYVGRVS